MGHQTTAGQCASGFPAVSSAPALIRTTHHLPCARKLGPNTFWPTWKGPPTWAPPAFQQALISMGRTFPCSTASYCAHLYDAANLQPQPRASSSCWLTIPRDCSSRHRVASQASVTCAKYSCEPGIAHAAPPTQPGATDGAWERPPTSAHSHAAVVLMPASTIRIEVDHPAATRREVRGPTWTSLLIRVVICMGRAKLRLLPQA